MKQLYSTAIALFLFFCSFAAPVNTVLVNNGSWNQNATWSQNRLPAAGDTVYVPAGMVLVVDNNVNLAASNVYIKLDGSLKLNNGKLDLGSGSVIYLNATGTVDNTKSNSETIKIGSVLKYQGTEKTIQGIAFASSATGTSPSGFSAVTNATLPVTFISFSVVRQSSDVLIQWSTAQEINAARFEIEKSQDGANWNKIAIVTAIGNSTTVQSYAYADKNVLTGTTYYRIRQVDIDGKFIFTAIKASTNLLSATEVKVAAVTQNKIVLQFNQQVKSAVAVQIISLNGTVVAQQVLNQPVGQVIVNTNNLRGNYIVSVTNNQDVNTHTQILF